MNGDQLFSDYAYAPGDEALPQPGTTDAGFNWTDFVNSTVRGVTQIITVSRQPPQTLPYTGSGTSSAGSQMGPAMSSNLIGLAVVGVLLYLLLK